MLSLLSHCANCTDSEDYIHESTEFLRNRTEVLNMISDGNMNVGEMWAEGRGRSEFYI